MAAEEVFVHDRSSKFRVLAVMAAYAAVAAALPAAAQQTTGGSQAERMQQIPSAQGGASDSERDPFRACVAAHPNDPNRHLNCDWNGKYSKTR